MANKSELKLDSDTSKAMEAMRNDEPVEVATPEPKVETPVEQPVVEEPSHEEPEAQETEAQTKKTVPLAALQEARESIKEERRRAEELQKRYEDRFNKLAEVLVKQGEPKQSVAPHKIPDPDTDALGTLRYNAQQIKELQDYKTNQENNQRQAAQRQELQMRAADLENQFIREVPDYNDAGAYLTNSRRNELAASGMYNPMQIGQILQNEAYALAQQAIQAGNNPAKIVYEIAKARGYAKKEAPPVASDADRLSKIEAGQNASKSLGQAQGAQTSSGKNIDGKTLANMSDDEFAKLYTKLSRSERAALMGG